MEEEKGNIFSKIKKRLRKDKDTETEPMNDYYTRYKEILEKKLVSEVPDGEKKGEFFEYLDGTYTYVQSERKMCEKKYFESEARLLQIGLAITGVNAIVSGLSAYDNDSLKYAVTVLSILATVLAGYLSYKQSIVMKKKYFERWNRHNNHYILLNKECRDYIEGYGEYSTAISDKDAREKFIKKIYEIEDEDIKAFQENMGKLQND